MQTTTKSVCRICSGGCGLIFTLENDRIVKVLPDRTHPISRGYACSKGLEAPVVAQGPDRLRSCLRRRPDGGFDPISLETALYEISDRLGKIIDKRGGESVGFYRGTGAHTNTTAVALLESLMSSLGSHNYYTTQTIDQSCHFVTAGRMGIWNAGKQQFEGSDTALLIGANPLVSLGAYQFLSYDPQKRLKAARDKGLKLIVIDPRRTETAKQADLFLQPAPGEDPTLLAGLVRLILLHGWHDRDFCNRWVNGLKELRAAVEPFTPEYVHSRTGIVPELLERAATVFARDSCRGLAVLGTGVSMSPRSNLSSHLVECLNIICGRVLREGETVPNPGVVSPPREFRAEAIPPNRTWEKGPKMVTGHGPLFGERPTGALADQILLNSPDQVRALFINGGNLAVTGPDQKRMVEALESLDLLVTCGHYLTATTALSDYVIAANTAFERPDVLSPPSYETFLFDIPYSQYLPPALKPPPGSEVVDEWYLYWGIAKHLGIQLYIQGEPLNMEQPPRTDEVLDLALKGSRIPIDELRGKPEGILLEESVKVLPPSPENNSRLELAPPDVVNELGEVAAEPASDARKPKYSYKLIVRRMRSVMNSLGTDWAKGRGTSDFNPAFMHPKDMELIPLNDGDEALISTDRDHLRVVVSPDPSLRPGVVSISHAWGWLPDDSDHFPGKGSNTNLLVRTDVGVETINAMPTMSSISVNIEPLASKSGTERYG